MPLLAALQQPPRPEHVQAGLDADLTFNPAAPAAGEGTVRLDGLIVETPDGRISTETPLTLRLGEGKLEILPVRLRIAGAGLQSAGVDLRGRADLVRRGGRSPIRRRPLYAISPSRPAGRSRRRS